MILIALGANLPSLYGAPENTLEAAKEALEAHGVHVLKSSSVLSTAPWPPSDQPWYKNSVIAVETKLDPLELLNTLHYIEQGFGRVRTVKNAPRLLDLDLIAYNGVIIDENDVYIPHPRLHNRGFVLYPIQEIAADWVHPILKRSVSALIEDLPDDQKISENEDIFEKGAA